MRGASTKSQVVVDRDSIKILADDKFPEDLNCEIFVGPNGAPHFHTAGQRTQLKTAAIDIDLGPSVSVVRTEGQANRYALYLFHEDNEGKVVGLFDLNFDGVWDVKKCPTRKQNFIFVAGQWIQVARIDGLLSATPTAEAQGIRYQFRGQWAPLH
jgi:hypothetical protein